MRQDDVKEDLRPLISDSYFLFSRFESAFKENSWLQSKTLGATTTADWKGFSYHADYFLSAGAKQLVAATPQKQIVGVAGLSFTHVALPSSGSQLDRITLLLKTVRNNLFHGGKYGSASRDDSDWLGLLLPLCISAALEELAELGGFQADFSGYY